MPAWRMGEMDWSADCDSQNGASSHGDDAWDEPTKSPLERIVKLLHRRPNGRGDDVKSTKSNAKTRREQIAFRFGETLGFTTALTSDSVIE